MSNAPFCNVSIATPKADPQKPVGLQPIPHVPDNPAINKVINIINNNFQQLIKGNYHENRAARRTTVVRVFDTDGSGAFVDVRQITALTFQNPLTGQLITWQQ